MTANFKKRRFAKGAFLIYALLREFNLNGDFIAAVFALIKLKTLMRQ